MPSKKIKLKVAVKKIPPVSVKGMHDIIGEEYYKYQGFIEKASEVAIYYGFKPIETPVLEAEELFVSGIGEETDIVEKELYTLRTRGGDRLALRPEWTAGLMRAYLEHGMQSWPQPVMLYAAGPLLRHDSPQKGRFRQFWQFDLEIMGSEKSINDAATIHVMKTILGEAGLKKIRLEVNSIGDRDCRHIFRRELSNYYKKYLPELCRDCNRRYKNNPLRLLDCKNEKCQPIKNEAPSPISHLCAACKRHFKEVLEYLEAMEIEYIINNNLVRGLDYYTRTVFEMFEDKPGSEGLSLCSGGRYDYLARTLGSSKDVPSVGAAIGVDRVVSIEEAARLTPRVVKKPKVFFIQLGFEAKLKSLNVTEILRRAKVPVAQSLSKESLSVQLGIAETMGVSYTIILGQKEVLDGTVIVRNMDNRSQDTVKISQLGEYLKNLK